MGPRRESDISPLNPDAILLNLQNLTTVVLSLMIQEISLELILSSSLERRDD